MMMNDRTERFSRISGMDAGADNPSSCGFLAGFWQTGNPMQITGQNIRQVIYEPGQQEAKNVGSPKEHPCFHYIPSDGCNLRKCKLGIASIFYLRTLLLISGIYWRNWKPLQCRYDFGTEVLWKSSSLKVGSR
jgi:hypothetical protein